MGTDPNSDACGSAGAGDGDGARQSGGGARAENEDRAPGGSTDALALSEEGSQANSAFAEANGADEEESVDLSLDGSIDLDAIDHAAAEEMAATGVPSPSVHSTQSGEREHKLCFQILSAVVPVRISPASDAPLIYQFKEGVCVRCLEVRRRKRKLPRTTSLSSTNSGDARALEAKTGSLVTMALSTTGASHANSKTSGGSVMPSYPGAKHASRRKVPKLSSDVDWVRTSCGWIVPKDAHGAACVEIVPMAVAEESWKAELDFRERLSYKLVQVLLRVSTLNHIQRVGSRIRDMTKKFVSHGKRLMNQPRMTNDEILLSLDAVSSINSTQVMDIIKVAAAQQSDPCAALLHMGQVIHRLGKDRPTTWEVQGLRVLETTSMQMAQDRFVEAAAEGNVEFLRNALADGSRKLLFAMHSRLGYAALHAACDFGQIEAATLLLEHMAPPDVQDKRFGRTALHYAAQNGRLEVIQLLYKFGADRHKTCFANLTPSIVAARDGQSDAEEMCKNPPPKPVDVHLEDVTPYTLHIGWQPPVLFSLHAKINGYRATVIPVLTEEEQEQFDESVRSELERQKASALAEAVAAAQTANGQESDADAGSHADVSSHTSQQSGTTFGLSAASSLLPGLGVAAAAGTTPGGGGKAEEDAVEEEQSRSGLSSSQSNNRGSSFIGEATAKILSNVIQNDDIWSDGYVGYTRQVDVESLETEIMGLRPAKTYEIIISAVSLAGVGEPCDSVVYTTLSTYPEQMRPPYLVRTTTSSLMLEWDEPRRDNGEAVENFELVCVEMDRVRYKDENGEFIDMSMYTTAATLSDFGLIGFEPIEENTRILVVRDPMERSKQFQKLLRGHWYALRIRARNVVGWSDYSDYSGPFLAQEAFKVTACEARRLAIEWQGPISYKPIDRFHLEYRSMAGKTVASDFITLTRKHRESSFEMNELSPGVEYQFRVTAMIGGEWKEENQAAISPPIRTRNDRPGVPGQLYLNPNIMEPISHDSVDLVWRSGAPNGCPVSRFHLQVRNVSDVNEWEDAEVVKIAKEGTVPRSDEVAAPPEGDGVFANCIGPNTLTMSRLTPGEVYQFRLREANVAGWSDFGPESELYRTKASLPPGKPMLNRLEATYIAIEWDPPADSHVFTPVQYEVQYAVVPGPMDGLEWQTFKTPDVAGEPATSALVDNLAPAMPYIFRVRARAVTGWTSFGPQSDHISTAPRF